MAQGHMRALGLPQGCERMDQLSCHDLVPKFFKATTMLQEQLELLLHGSIVPNLPHKIKLTRMKLAPYDREETEMTNFIEQVKESEATSFGVIVNSFYDFEPDYYRKVLGKRAWHIGPILLNRKNEGKSPKSDDKQHECLQWLETKKENSVIYVCFGSMSNLTDPQMEQIALGVEARARIHMGFEERTKGKGLIIRGWAPQVLILDHKRSKENGKQGC